MRAKEEVWSLEEDGGELNKTTQLTLFFDSWPRLLLNLKYAVIVAIMTTTVHFQLKSFPKLNQVVLVPKPTHTITGVLYKCVIILFRKSDVFREKTHEKSDEWMETGANMSQCNLNIPDTNRTLYTVCVCVCVCVCVAPRCLSSVHLAGWTYQQTSHTLTIESVLKRLHNRADYTEHWDTESIWWLNQ